ncbi:MAG TPA: hypothetical protein VK446_14970 [Methylocystis sp.]|nr:hypothetical protein [Methylocystis sp.]
MATAQALSGLTKWLERDEWMTEFQEVLQKHVGCPCAEHGLERRELFRLLGEAGFMNVWGCALEDFMTRTFDDGSNFVDDYLKRRGWKESPGTKRYMTALRHSLMSLYEVVEANPGESFLARDLVRGGDILLVHERSGSNQLKKWDRIGARVVICGGKACMSGGLLVFDRETGDELLRYLKQAIEHFPKVRQRVKDDLDLDNDDPFLALCSSPQDALRFAGAVFTNIWLSKFLDKAFDTRPQRIENSEGDEPTTIRWPAIRPPGCGRSSASPSSAAEAQESRGGSSRISR